MRLDWNFILYFGKYINVRVFDYEVHSYKFEYKIYFEPCNNVVCSGMFATCESFHFLAAMHMSAHTYMAVSCACYSQYSVVCLVECTVHHMVCKI
jgi:hypothetical protein